VIIHTLWTIIHTGFASDQLVHRPPDCNGAPHTSSTGKLDSPWSPLHVGASVIAQRALLRSTRGSFRCTSAKTSPNGRFGTPGRRYIFGELPAGPKPPAGCQRWPVSWSAPWTRRVVMPLQPELVVSSRSSVRGPSRWRSTGRVSQALRATAGQLVMRPLLLLRVSGRRARDASRLP
jgi:hypothetical protein